MPTTRLPCPRRMQAPPIPFATTLPPTMVAGSASACYAFTLTEKDFNFIETASDIAWTTVRPLTSRPPLPAPSDLQTCDTQVGSVQAVSSWALSVYKYVTSSRPFRNIITFSRLPVMPQWCYGDAMVVLRRV